MSALTADMPKVLANINGRPAVHHVIDFWRPWVDEFVFIVGYKKELVIEYISSLGIPASFVEQTEMRGIANAVMHAEGLVDERFVVVLGDCLCKGGFRFPDGLDQGFGVIETQNERDIRQSYSVEIQDGALRRVVEKPKELINNICGMGFYFFSRTLFEYIRKTPPSALRGEVEITDVIQGMIDGGERVSPVWFDGDYINLTYPEDIERASHIFK